MKTMCLVALALMVAITAGCNEQADLAALAQASPGNASAPPPPEPGEVAGAAAQTPNGGAVAPAEGAAAAPAADPNKPAEGNPPAAAPAEGAAQPPAADPNKPAEGNPPAAAAPAVADPSVKGDVPENYLEALAYTLLTIDQRLIFEVQLPKAMDLYKAQHDNKAPATQEDFMSEIIDGSGIDLPTLAPGDRYYYDPKTGKLGVIATPK